MALSLAYSPDGKTLVTAGFHGAIDLWDVVENKKVVGLRSERFAIRFVTFAPDGKVLASVGDEGLVRLWDVPAGTLKQTSSQHERVDTSGRTSTFSGPVAFAPDGHHLAISAWGSEDATVHLMSSGSSTYETAGPCGRTWAAGKALFLWRLLPDGKTFASPGSEDGQALGRSDRGAVANSEAVARRDLCPRLLTGRSDAGRR